MLNPKDKLSGRGERVFGRAVRGACVTLAVAVTLGGCTTTRVEGDLVWAVNVGGPAYSASDGTSYEADNSITGGPVGTMQTVKGSQDAPLYRTYRQGAIEVVRPLANGVYDITMHFAEPADIDATGRVFDAFAQGKRVMQDLDVMRFRDGKIESALTVTVPGVAVNDGQLKLSFRASAAEPVLSAIQVRMPAARNADWQLVWRDEFDYDGAPDPARWTADIWPARKVNDEDQAYTARAKNLRVEDGFLIVEAHREDYRNARYTSGRLHSKDKGDIHYGRVEVRAKLPAGKGTWPAIWMLPSDPFRYASNCEAGSDWQGSDTCDAWPNSGEIDIMEHVGYQMNHVHGTVHTKAYYWLVWEQRKGRILLDDVSANFYTYALEWDPEQIRVFVDDTLYFVYVNEGGDWRTWPFDHPFHLIMNVAVGGQWGRAGGGIDDDIFPQRLVVDYVRVYARPGAD